MAPMSGVDLGGADKPKGWRVQGPGEPRAAGVQTAGPGPEPSQQCLKAPGLPRAERWKSLSFVEAIIFHVEAGRQAPGPRGLLRRI